MSVHDAEPGDIYVDKGGKLWRCVGICRDPTVIMEEVEGRTPDPQNLQMSALQHVPMPSKVEIIKSRQSGGVTGFMWEGWKRIFRPGA